LDTVGATGGSVPSLSCGGGAEPGTDQGFGFGNKLAQRQQLESQEESPE